MSILFLLILLNNYNYNYFRIKKRMSIYIFKGNKKNQNQSSLWKRIVPQDFADLGKYNFRKNQTYVHKKSLSFY
ncbi:hypothetical protein HanIR_Chr14g0713561 [Helianthus annuus]|nr:hypothetical protein HanIR_Chr14g0713561 [Helianthus annuus]